MATDALFHFQSDLRSDEDFDEYFPDHYDHQNGFVTNQAKNTDNITLHAEKPTISNFLQEQEVDSLRKEQSRLANIPKRQ